MGEVGQQVAEGRDGVVDADERDFDGVYRREYAPLVRLATVVCGDPSVAEEVTQQAFARAWGRWATLDQPGAYLQRSVVNGAIDEVRRSGRRRRRDRSLRVVDARAAAPPTEPLWDVLDALPDAQRVAVVLRFYLDRSIAEIAEVTGRPENTVKSDLRRATAALAEELRDA